ncbi:ubiquitin-conjugating enzyme E2, putative [Plasmodium ovale wallikeri]|uniref:Ubiquitin-conjugating enzyme E2, putative n=1 Tax=Plasmodium ovale wallikeri TaxID=864142 RepID=A0A1A9A236_PLAOA|nr:ubiquitin-conjugating enzyme E2, putative [Plasmodium ovale wallikeri]
MWYDNERIQEEEGVSKLLVGKTFAYFPKYADDEYDKVYGRKSDGEKIYQKESISSEANMSTIHNMDHTGNTACRNSFAGGSTHDGPDGGDAPDGKLDKLDKRDASRNDDLAEYVRAGDDLASGNKEYVLIPQRLGRTIIPLNPQLLAQTTYDQEIIDKYIKEIHQNVHNYLILTEYSFLIKEIPTNFYCLPQYDDLYILDGFLILYSTIYKNAKLKIQIKLGKNYPYNKPEVYFLTPIYHPLINLKTGKLNLGIFLNNWSPTNHYISLLFLYIKNIFYLKDEYNNNTVENNEAYFLLNNKKNIFLKKVRKYINISNNIIYNQFDNYMFNFNKNFNNIHILNKLDTIKKDPFCLRKAEAFIHWLINDFTYTDYNVRYNNRGNNERDCPNIDSYSEYEEGYSVDKDGSHVSLGDDPVSVRGHGGKYGKGGVSSGGEDSVCGRGNNSDCGRGNNSDCSKGNNSDCSKGDNSDCSKGDNSDCSKGDNSDCSKGDNSVCSKGEDSVCSRGNNPVRASHSASIDGSYANKDADTA